MMFDIFRVECCKHLRQNGLCFVESIYSTEMYCSNKDNIQSFFSPQFNKQRGKYRMAGFVGIYSKLFQDSNENRLEHPPMNLLIGNIPSLVYIPEVDRFDSTMELFIDEICHFVMGMPSDLDSLKLEMRCGYINGIELYKFGFEDSNFLDFMKWVELQ